MSESKIIAILAATSQAARIAWGQSQNQDRWPAAPLNDQVRDISSREATPAVQYSEPQLQLTFDNMPKDGLSFGSDRASDVWLGERKHGFSFQLFRILLTAENHLVFRDLWKGKTTVKYNDETAPCRQGFVWVLFRNRPDIEISMKKDGFEFNFKIKWPDRSEQQNVEYEIHLKQYLQEHRNVMPILTQLLAKQDSCRQQPIYLLNEELGRGSFGTVYKSVNVSTALVCAVKKFRDPEGHMKEVEILKELSHVGISVCSEYNEV